MADRDFYHQQPCFCIPCRVLKESGEAPRPKKFVDEEKPAKKKTSGRKKS
jgi:hypothetical protein